MSISSSASQENLPVHGNDAVGAHLIIRRSSGVEGPVAATVSAPVSRMNMSSGVNIYVK